MKDLYISNTTGSQFDFLQKKGPSTAPAGQKTFGDFLQNAVGEVNQMQLQADQAAVKVQTQDTTSIHEVMIALEKADISFRTMLQVRNKVLEAYQEIMRLSV